MLLGWRCPVCGAEGRVPCAACHARLQPAGPLPRLAGIDHAAALLSYRGVGRELVARAKFRNQRAGFAWLASGMAALVDPVVATALDVVTWAPATPSHVRWRGFDHGKLLAIAVGRCLHRPAAELLWREHGTALTGRSAEQRRHDAPRLRVRPRLPAGLVGATVLVVDDVVTTGTTLVATAAVLRAAGARSVHAVAAAYTSPPG